MDIRELCQQQRAFFKQGKTLQAAYRLDALRRMRTWIRVREVDILDALSADLGKSSYEAYMTEIGMVLEEISYMLRHVRTLSSKKHVRTPLAQFYAHSYVLPKPYGNVLIMSPWNYPFLLTIGPLVDALAAGNTAVLKPSNYSPHVSRVISRLISDCFEPEYVSVVEGGREANTTLLDEKFDYIFFTGGKTVGRLVMNKAAAHLTPVTLELGGKSPCIVDDSAQIALAARRIVFGKFINAGQTCIAPDYVIAHESIYEQLLEAMRAEIVKQYGDHPLRNAQYGKIINAKHYERLMGLLTGEKPEIGGEGDPCTQKIAPTLLANATLASPAMQEEIFGPILPVLKYHEISEVPALVNEHPTPLALYVFSENRKSISFLQNSIAFGGCCVNDVIIHIATTAMGFGGVGESGMGSYHGKAGFDTFTHYASVVEKSTRVDLRMRYQPYGKHMLGLIKWFMH